MAHANPEFALACRAHRDPPLAHQLPPPASLGALRARMAALLAIPEDERTPEQASHIAIWLRARRQDRRQVARERSLRDALPEPAGGMHGADRRGERFAEPKRRLPADVQAGRVKVRRGTLTQ